MINSLENILSNKVINNTLIGFSSGLFGSIIGYIIIMKMDTSIYFGWESYIIGNIFIGAVGGIISRNFLKLIVPSLIILGLLFIFFLIHPLLLFISSLFTIGFSIGLTDGIIEGDNMEKIINKGLMGELGQVIGIASIIGFNYFLPVQSIFGKKHSSGIIIMPTGVYIILLTAITGASIWFFISLYDEIIKIPKEEWQKRFSVLNRKLW